MDELNIPQQRIAPKRYCMITLMFPIQDDKEALGVKAAIDAQIAGKEEKRYTFQIVDN